MTPLAYPFQQPEELRLDAAYAYLREHEPVRRVRMPYGEDAWLVTRYDDARFVLADPRFSGAMAAERDPPRMTPGKFPAGNINALDPPEHTRLRRVLNKAFGARQVELLRPYTQHVADTLVDQMLKAGPPAEIITDYALPLPLTVICEMLGVPEADRERVHRWSEAFLSTSSLSPRQRQWRFARFGYYMWRSIARRRRRSADDLLSVLVHARDDQGHFTTRELIVLGMTLIAAGHETTHTQITNMVYLLLTRPEILRTVSERPDLLPHAIDELMRYIPLFVGAAMPRYATEDVRVGDVVVHAGEPVLVSLGSANHDPRVFTDPGHIAPARTPNPHIGFGHGAHFCVGAQLALMELEVALATLLRRLPAIALALPEDEVQWKAGTITRGPRALPITWRAHPLHM